MNILLDFTQIPLQKVGVGVYAYNLINSIYKKDDDNSYLILTQDDESCFDNLKKGNFKIVKVKSRLCRIFLIRLLLEQIYIPVLALTNKISILHSMHYSFPLFAFSKKVITIHDLTFFKYPRSHIPIKKMYFGFFLRLSSVFSDRTIGVSKSTINDYKEMFNVDSHKTRVIHHGREHVLQHEVSNQEIALVKAKFNISKKYLLFIGTLEPRKNIENIIIAFSKLLDENNEFQLVLAGKKGWHYKQIFSLVNKSENLKNCIIFTDFIADADKDRLIAGCHIFIYPSIYEGFGIPVLEALAHGKPTITSSISSLPEVAGEAALKIDPLNPEEIYLAIKRLTTDSALYEKLKVESKKQAEKFSWDRAAQETIEVYNSLR